MNISGLSIRSLLALSATMMFGGIVQAAELTGAGASLPAPVYERWSDAYLKATGNRINYQSIGSGGGIKEVSGKSIDFGTTDIPLSTADLEKNGLLQFPTMVGGAVPIINLPGIKTDELRLSGVVLGDIYMGKITQWNDKAIRALNPSVKLPDMSIAIVHRGDGAGTSFVFTNYLSKVHPQWRDKVGTGTIVQWPTGMHGKGDEGVATFVRNLPGAIGYVEYAYARQKKLDTVQMQNRAGSFVSANEQSLKAAANAPWQQSAFGEILTDQAGQDVWPIAGATFIVMRRKEEKAAAANEALKFFLWSYRNGAAMAQAQGYAPLPERVMSDVQAHWSGIVDAASGKPVFGAN
ncbi:phosphate ABC transporter substrate-binding protein PstS [Uliginosibacterium sp. H3]|uniref:Phosphate-binding protein PstS n=1 Tax=Uliginosibacterium silvisoli TaxID=3114758 RepID=A0ABU6K747_9RHOO|nr:phosphate ABC transporter substrate-binding protein PstS [Uliginosibacterium sp. H3]